MTPSGCIINKITADPIRLRIEIQGTVQGVGFRPFVYRLANENSLSGWVSNDVSGVVIEVEGGREKLESFIGRLQLEKPSISHIDSLTKKEIEPDYKSGMHIIDSGSRGKKSALVLPDLAICPDCHAEIFDPKNRRYLYPFTNCTNCGPRYSIIENLPYDRDNTTMKTFQMCPQCRAEYEDPLNRRFHAQPNACPECGPYVELWDHGGTILASERRAIRVACRAIEEGEIIALKGLGGFQLLVDASNPNAVQKLRDHKNRPEKPFALMFPSYDQIEKQCSVSNRERELLHSPQAPILLLQRKICGEKPEEFAGVAPGNPYLGIMLPCTPLHHIIMKIIGRPIVATSGNLTGEPICIDEYEALERLSNIADLFLVHNRPIARHVDDSIARIILDREIILRRARGYAPLPIQIKSSEENILALGGHQKASIAISNEKRVFVSQHIGDLDSSIALQTFENTIDSLASIYDLKPNIIVRDKHPDYASSSYGKNESSKRIKVQHHYAHILSCMAEHGISGPALGIAWDGTGYGDDGTIWGGEFLSVNIDGYRRAGYIRQFRLPSGDKAIIEPRRAALGLLYEIYGKTVLEKADVLSRLGFRKSETAVFRRMLCNGINSPLCSSMGRLFDAVSALTGLCGKASFEGQAAMALEFAIDKSTINDQKYSCEIRHFDDCYILDWGDMVEEILDDVEKSVNIGTISIHFHNTLIDAAIKMAQQIKIENVVLSGGCFQNAFLLENMIQRLSTEGFNPIWHRRVPSNDGGLCLGQIEAARRMLKESH